MHYARQTAYLSAGFAPQDAEYPSALLSRASAVPEDSPALSQYCLLPQLWVGVMVKCLEWLPGPWDHRFPGPWQCSPSKEA